MLELAGEIADGAVLWLCTPTYIRTVALPAIRRGRERTGQSLDDFEIVAAVPAALTVDPGPALTLFRGELTRYLALPFYRAMLQQSGFSADIASYDRAPSAAAVPDSLAAALCAIGDFRAISETVAAYRDAGVTLPAIRPIAFPDAAHYLPTMEAAIGS